MTESLQARLTRLEMLYSEQDHTTQALNDMVARQDREISRLRDQLEQINGQLQLLKTEFGNDIDPVHEKPPHY